MGSSAKLALENVTVTGNSATSEGGGVYFADSELTLKNTIVANNTSGGNCALNSFYPAVPTSLGYNLSSDTTCTTWLNKPSDLNNVNPLLGALADNGGLTKTHLPQAGSPALNKIPQGTNGCGTTLTSDQRGITRPQGGKCDIGAVEVAVANATPTQTATRTSTPTQTTVAPTTTRTPTQTTVAPTGTRTPTPSATATLACTGKPAKPLLTAPAKNTTTTNKRVTLKWNAVPCVQSYQVVVRQDSKNGTTVDNANTTGLSHKTPALAKGHTYFWYVQACNAAAQCSKSVVWKFKVQ